MVDRSLPEKNTHVLTFLGRGRGIAWGFGLLAPLLCGLLAVALGQDANWDFRNYHWYNAYAFLNNRYALDFLPSQLPFFYNPLLDVPFYLLASHVPARVAGFALGFVQGLNAPLVFALAFTALAGITPRRRAVLSVLLATLGVLGGGGIGLIGTTFYDNVTSLGVLGAMILLLRAGRDPAASLGRVALRGFVSGLPMGVAVGLKIPCAFFAVALGAGTLVFPGTVVVRLARAAGFGVGVLVGFAVVFGPWGWFLATHFGNPFFPYFNDVFQSPFAPSTSFRDTKFVPSTWTDRLLFPFLFLHDPHRVGEILWRDARVPILYVLLPLAVGMRLFFWRHPDERRDPFSLFHTWIPAFAGMTTRERAGTNFYRPTPLATPEARLFLLTVGALAYGLWLMSAAIYRYLLPLEMLTPLLIALTVDLLPLGRRGKIGIVIVLLGTVAISVSPGNWTRRAAWTDRFVEVTWPKEPLAEGTMILMATQEPYAHVIPSLPPSLPVVRIESNIASPRDGKGLNALIAERVAHHKGPFVILIPSWSLDYVGVLLKGFHLALVPDSCQDVQDHVYDSQLVLCRVARRPLLTRSS